MIGCLWKQEKSLYKMVDVKKFANIDLYGLIGVEIGATESEVNKCFWIHSKYNFVHKTNHFSFPFV